MITSSTYAVFLLICITPILVIKAIDYHLVKFPKQNSHVTNLSV
jgi:hypothetical protein